MFTHARFPWLGPTYFQKLLNRVARLVCSLYKTKAYLNNEYAKTHTTTRYIIIICGGGYKLFNFYSNN